MIDLELAMVNNRLLDPPPRNYCLESGYERMLFHVSQHMVISHVSIPISFIFNVFKTKKMFCLMFSFDSLRAISLNLEEENFYLDFVLRSNQSRETHRREEKNIFITFLLICFMRHENLK